MKGIAMSYNNIGNIYMEKGDYDQALEYHEKALKIRKDIGDKFCIFTFNQLSGFVSASLCKSYKLDKAIVCKSGESFL